MTDRKGIVKVFISRVRRGQPAEVMILDLAAVPPEVGWEILSSARSNADT